MVQIASKSLRGLRLYDYVKYTTSVTFYVWLSFPFLSFPFLSFPFLSFPFIFLLTSTGQTGKPITMVNSSNDAFPPKEVPFLGYAEKLMG